MVDEPQGPPVQKAPVRARIKRFLERKESERETRENAAIASEERRAETREGRVRRQEALQAARMRGRVKPRPFGETRAGRAVAFLGRSGGSKPGKKPRKQREESFFGPNPLLGGFTGSSKPRKRKGVGDPLKGGDPWAGFKF